MGPKAFITCYVCFREFGSRSIPFHEPKCLERWRSSNRSLPPEKRSPTPVKPVGWKYSTETTWLCTNCQISVPSAKRGEHAATCFGKKSDAAAARPGGGGGGRGEADGMAAGTKKVTSPKKGTENRNSTNDGDSGASVVIEATSTAGGDGNSGKRANQEPKKGEPESKKAHTSELVPETSGDKDVAKETEQKVSTSNRSIRPQTKTLRRPTPNLKHPVIQTDSDESGDSSDKSKDEEKPKRMKHNSGGHSGHGEHRTKNFIMYNKYNVEKNTKTSPKERSAIAAKEVYANSIPYPCNSCSRSVAPERLHSHSRKDSRGMMLKKMASVESKTPSPQKKLVPSALEEKKPKEAKSPVLRKEKASVPNESSDSSSSDGAGASNVRLEKALSVPKGVANPGHKKTANSLNICYVCGKDPSPTSLSVHESRCLERWKKENGLVSPSRRKPPAPKKQPETEKTEGAIATTTTTTTTETQDRQSKPDLPKENGAGDSAKDDTDPAWQAVQAQLVPCPSCGRTFFPERLPVHQRVCKGKVLSSHFLSRANSLRETTATYNEEPGDKQSIYVPCYICGRSFGTWVIQMHESQCLRKWRRANEKLPEHLQQQEPHKPQLFLTTGSLPDDKEATETAWESHLQQLVPCQRCGRTFFPDRLEVHGRSCKGPTVKQQQLQPPKSSSNNSKGQ